MQVGFNKYRGQKLKEISNEIYLSDTGRYFITFDDTLESSKSQLNTILDIVKPNSILTLDERINKGIVKSTSKDVHLYEPLNMILVDLSIQEIEILTKNFNNFKISPEKVITYHKPILSKSQKENNWGIELVLKSNPKEKKKELTGKGVKVAIIDTGLDTSHLDFSKRPNIVKKSFVGNSSEDKNGHGTFCTGIACGYKTNNGSGIRYGIAYNSTIYAIKALNNRGEGKQGKVIEAIMWAADKGCKVISLSLGTRNTITEIEKKNIVNHIMLSLKKQLNMLLRKEQ